jgi:hypothetical protein
LTLQRCWFAEGTPAVPPDTPLAEAIAMELGIAFRKLGAKPEDLDGLDWNDKEAVMAVARELGASFDLLRTIGSRGESLSDDVVLRHLNALNQGGTMYKKVISEGD